MARKRDDGYYMTQIVIGHKEDGKPIRKSIYGKTKAELEEKKREFLNNKNGQPVNKDIALSEWVDMWVESYGINLERKKSYVNKLKRELGKYKICDVTEVMCAKSLKYYAGKSASSATNYRRVMIDVFNAAKKNGYIFANPAEDLKLPDSKPKGTHRALSDEEIHVLLSRWREHRLGVPTAIMLLAGLRRGEVLGLTWENIDLQNRTINVCQTAVRQNKTTEIKPWTKTDAGMRVVPISDLLLSILVTVDDKKGYVIKPSVHRKDSIDRPYISILNFSRNFDVYMRHLKLNVRMHDLRHTYATMLYEANVDIKTAQLLLGHADVSVTMTLYTHLSEKKKAQNTDKLNEYLNRTYKVVQ